MFRLEPRRALRLVAVAFVAYLALLLPWRFATRVYSHVLAPPARAIVQLADDEVALDAVGPDLRYVRLYEEARTAAANDLRGAPLLFVWMKDLFGPLHRAMYPFRLPSGGAARSTAIVQYVDVFRLSLELPLFLALLLALPAVPWRRRLKPLAIGLAVFVPIHVFLATTPGFWLAAGAGHLRPTEQGAIEFTAGGWWLRFTDHYQYVGPVLAFGLFIALLALGAFDAKSPKAPAPARPSTDS